ncbi:hypothetical protein FM107_09775 [Sphingobacterium sp. JB170]|nr:hypothetical protein FM107_09775 [Sphingobacterium sp. JB170]
MRRRLFEIITANPITAKVYNIYPSKDTQTGPIPSETKAC